MRSSKFEDDICGARYDRLLFAAERCQASAAESAGTKVKAPSPTPSSNRAHQRRKILELGAMSLLESQLELEQSRSMVDTENTPQCGTSVCGGSRHRPRQSGHGGKEEETYRSCLETLLDRHYLALREYHRSQTSRQPDDS